MKKEFDFLSEDSDSYDFFMLEAILAAGYRPRVIMVEINANFELTATYEERICSYSIHKT